MKSIYSPDNVPIRLFFFGWKKAMRYVQTNNGIFNPVEVELFNRNLNQNLRKLKKDFEDIRYTTDPTLTYLLPKSMLGGKRRARPMVQFSFRDQVAWATTMLVLGEWFDTSGEIAKRIPIYEETLRDCYEWMVPWSYNNRIKRMHQFDNSEGDLKRLFLHYNHRDIYESYQWGLRNIREARKNHFESIRKVHGDSFYGEIDIKEFYPTLKITYIITAMQERFKHLQQNGAISLDSTIKWISLLPQLCHFELDFTKLINEPSINDEESIKQLEESIAEEPSTLPDKLKETLPIGLISSGFLSNCALTHFFDRPLNEFIENLLDNNKKDQLYVLRYTDDMTIISSRNELVLKTMDKAVALLNSLQLSISKDKTKPKEYEFNRDAQEDIELLKIIPKVKRRERIPGSTAVIEKLSQFGEHKLWAMNHEQLQIYLSEMLNLIQTKFESNEIKDETKTTFAAWRLLRSESEISQRHLNYSDSRKVTNVLHDALLEYPYKTSLIEVYIIHLFQHSEDIGMEVLLDQFLQSFKQDLKPEMQYPVEEHLGSFGAYMRSSVLEAISNHWLLVPVSIREKFNKLLYKHLTTWYRKIPTWHEQAAIYRMLAATNIQFNPGAVRSDTIDEQPAQVNHMFRIFQCSIRNKEALFQKDSDNRFDSSNISMLSVVLQMLYQRRPKQYRLRNLMLQDEKEWIKWCWRLVDQEKRHMSEFSYMQFVLYLARYDKSFVTKHGYMTLLQDIPESHDNRSLNKDETDNYYNELLHFLDNIINDWIDFSIHKTHVLPFIKALKEIEGSSTYATNYAHERLSNLAWIKLHICKSRNGMSQLPESVLMRIQGPKKELIQPKPSLLDWLAVTSSHSMAREDKYMNRLSEYEVVYITRFVAEKLQKEEWSIDNIRIRNIVISADGWTKWRESMINHKVSAGTAEQWGIRDLSLPSELYDPDWFYLQRALKYVNGGVSDLADEHINFKDCFILTALLTQLLSNGRVNGREFDFSKILSWRGTQYVIENCGAPSSEIITLITSTINYFHLFYKEQYDKLGNFKIPYQPFISENTVDLNLYISVLKSIEQKKSQQYLHDERGLLEIRIVNIDQWVKESKPW